MALDKERISQRGALSIEPSDERSHYYFHQGDEVGGRNERCPLTSNFDAKEEIHEVKKSTLLTGIC